MNTVSISRIEVEEVENLDVYNIEIESKEENDDLFYGDVESGIIHHNCLRKDFGMINESFPQTDIILQAYKANEYMPKFYVDLVKDMIKGNQVAVLGYTMKRDTDDTRDSLVPKMIRYIMREVPEEIRVHDPNLPMGEIDDSFNGYKFDNVSYAHALDEADIVFLAMNHSKFSEELFKEAVMRPGKIVVDIWGLLGDGIVNVF